MIELRLYGFFLDAIDLEILHRAVVVRDMTPDVRRQGVLLRQTLVRLGLAWFNRQVRRNRAVQQLLEDILDTTCDAIRDR